MISKNTIKLIKSLALKKYRTKEQLFLVEGDKLLAELVESNFPIKELIVTTECDHAPKKPSKNIEKITYAESKDIKQASLLKNPQNSIAICRIPATKDFPTQLPNTLSVYLDGIQDPGNLGTILRICDWFGIKDIFCSPDTVDLYNPKVIQASMGSFKRINFWESEFRVIKELAKTSDTILFGAFMDGKNIYKETLPQNALLVMGNEGKGICKEVESLIDERISIPNFSVDNNKAESLNVSVATAILCSEFKRLQ